jgi:hypothetical protein
LAAVKKTNDKEQWGFINHTGNWVIPPHFGDAGYFKDGLAPVAIDFKYGFIDRQGDLIIQPQYEHAYSFSEGLACIIDSEQKYGFIDEVGQIVIAPEFELGFSFENGVAMVAAGKWVSGGSRDIPHLEGNWRYVDRTGRRVW